MDQFTSEQNFQLFHAIDMIDYLADEILLNSDSEPLVEEEVFSRW
jgi:hypothetical protein